MRLYPLLFAPWKSQYTEEIYTIYISSMKRISLFCIYSLIEYLTKWIECVRNYIAIHFSFSILPLISSRYHNWMPFASPKLHVFLFCNLQYNVTLLYPQLFYIDSTVCKMLFVWKALHFNVAHSKTDFVGCVYCIGIQYCTPKILSVLWMYWSCCSHRNLVP